MKRISHSKSLMQSEKVCYVTGSSFNLHRHHIFHGRSLRRKSEEYGCWCYLIAPLHNTSKQGVHNGNTELDLKLKRECQARFEEKYGHTKFMELFGRNYL